MASAPRPPSDDSTVDPTGPQRPDGAAGPPAAAPVQRWRLTYRRLPEAPPLQQREQLAAWEAALASSGLPLAVGSGGAARPRIVTAAALTVGMAAEQELLDLFLVDRLPVADVRAHLIESLPEGHELVDIHDVWLGEPALSGQVEAADYRIELTPTAGGGPTASDLVAASVRLLARPTIPRTRSKGERTVSYDLRPLLASIDVVGANADSPSSTLELRVRTRFDPERGVGRPEEVVGALADDLGQPLVAGSIVREALIVRGQPAPSSRRG